MQKEIFILTEKDRKIIDIGRRAQSKLDEIEATERRSERWYMLHFKLESFDLNVAGRRVAHISKKYGIMSIGSGSYHAMHGRPLPCYIMLEALPMLSRPIDYSKFRTVPFED